MAFTPLPAAAVVGTDVCFGLGLSPVGGGISLFSGHYDPAILPNLLRGGILGALLAPNLVAVIPARYEELCALTNRVITGAAPLHTLW